MSNHIKYLRISFFSLIIFFFSCNPEIEGLNIVISEVTPTTVDVGNIICVYGENLSQVNGAKIGNVKISNASFNSINDSLITMQIPDGVTFPCSVIMISGSREFAWEGELSERESNPEEDVKYSFESRDAQVLDYLFYSSSYNITCRNYGDTYGVGANIISITISGDIGFLSLNLIAPKGSYSFVPTGTYPFYSITTYDDIKPYRAWASSGNNNSGSPNPSYLAKRNSYGNYEIYYLREGEVTIPNAAMLNLRAISYFGSIIKVRYTGTLQVN